MAGIVLLRRAVVVRRVAGVGAAGWAGAVLEVAWAGVGSIAKGDSSSPSAPAPMIAETSSTDELAAADVLPGADIILSFDDGTRVRADESVALAKISGDGFHGVSLDDGEAAFEVEPQGEGRSFRVQAGDVAVRVIGTAFTVRHDSDSGTVSVVVTEGVVAVMSADGEESTLRAGDSWSGSAERDDVVIAPVDSSSETAQDVAAIEPKKRRSATKRLRKRRAPRAEKTEPGSEVASAAELLAMGRTAQRAGKTAEAEEAFAGLLQAHPRDARAGVAALELGRLRMDRLGDDRGAVKALTRALKSPGATRTIREDAMARLVRLHAKRGESRACARMKTRYLSAFPDGLHVSDLPDCP